MRFWKWMMLFSGMIACLCLNAQSPDLQKNSTIFSFDYFNNTNAPGNINTAIKQPSLSPSAAFLGKKGIDLMITGNFIDNSDDSLDHFTAELDLFVGYQLKPFKNLTIYPNYTHFIYSSNANFYNTMFHGDLRLDVDYALKNIGLGFSSGYLTGKHSSFYFITRSDYQINIDHFMYREGSMLIQPGIDLSFGSYEYLNQFYLDELRQYPSYYYYIYFNSPQIRRYVLKEKLKSPGSSVQEIIDEMLEEETKDSFKMTSVSISLPFFFMIRNIGVNLGLFMFIPAGQPDYLSGDPVFYINAGISYSLEL